jgi:hypothetical protein
MKDSRAEEFSHERLAHLSLAEIKELRKRSAQSRERTRAPKLVPQDRSCAVPLSYAQERLWFLNQLGVVGSAYNMAMALSLQGKLNLIALELSFAELIHRHEALRTRYESIADSPIQVVDSPGKFVLGFHNLSELGEQEQSVSVRRLCCEEAQRPFNLTTGPLLRASLIELAPEDHVLLLTMHHIVSDGWSLGILNRELSALYSAYVEGQAKRCRNSRGVRGPRCSWCLWLRTKYCCHVGAESRTLWWGHRLQGAEIERSKGLLVFSSIRSCCARKYLES